jgi:uncharacterized protein YprB with RNaseH-like and TPR domain
MQPRILYFDIETSPNLCFTWGLGKQYVGYENIHKERQVTVVCWKWSDETQVRSLSFNLDKHDLSRQDDNADKELLKIFSAVYQRADLAVGHNGIKFDIATIRARLVKHGLPDIAPIVVDDTYLASKGIRFNSHKLDYLAQYLGIGKKAPHDYSLWKRVMGGDRTALNATESYCKQDVLLLEKIYKRMKPYTKSKLNRAVFLEKSDACPSCGKQELQSAGVRCTVSGGRFSRYRCQACGHYSQRRVRKGGGYPQ